MTNIIEGRRRGNGGGTRGIRADGDQFYQRRNDDEKPYWPGLPKADSSTTTQQLPSHDQTTTETCSNPLTSGLGPQDEGNLQATIDAAKKIFQNRKPRRKKRVSLLSATGTLDDDAFAFSSKPPRPKQLQSRASLTPIGSGSSSNTDEAHLPLVTPAASVASFAVPTNVVAEVKGLKPKHEVARESPLSWHSPRPHSPTQDDNHQRELADLKERHRLQLEELVSEKKILESSIRQHENECRKWKDRCAEKDIAIKEIHQLRIKHETFKDERNSLALREAVAIVEKKHAISHAAIQEEHKKAVSEAVELERQLLAARMEKENKAREGQILELQQTLESCQAQLRQQELVRIRSMAEHQLEQQKFANRLLNLSRVQREADVENQAVKRGLEEEKERIEDEKLALQCQISQEVRSQVVLESADNFFSKDSPSTPPIVHRLPLVKRLVCGTKPQQYLDAKKEPFEISQAVSRTTTASAMNPATFNRNDSAMFPTGRQMGADASFRSSDKDFEQLVVDSGGRYQESPSPDGTALSIAALLMGLSNKPAGVDDEEPSLTAEKELDEAQKYDTGRLEVQKNEGKDVKASNLTVGKQGVTPNRGTVDEHHQAYAKPRSRKRTVVATTGEHNTGKKSLHEFIPKFQGLPPEPSGTDTHKRRKKERVSRAIKARKQC